ncbi:PO23 protein, partial [Menura novaehollandiae]|nr:PO23 protein [Menura novaehollandiae]
KAFDTVSHQHILRGLKQRGVDPQITTLVKNMHENIHTYITTTNEKTDPIQTQAGVKQGNPMSPFLFNLALDTLLCKVEERGKGNHEGGNTVMAMAFAGDLVLLSHSWQSMKHETKILETFCNLTALKT